MKNIMKAMSAVVVSLAMLFAFGATNFAFADTVSDCASLPTPAERAACASTAADPEGGSRDLLTTVRSIINTVLTVIGVLCAAMIIYGGVLYSISQGDASKMTKAKNTIMYAVAGVIICLVAFAIVNFVMAALSN